MYIEYLPKKIQQKECHYSPTDPLGPLFIDCWSEFKLSSKISPAHIQNPKLLKIFTTYFKFKDTDMFKYIYPMYLPQKIKEIELILSPAANLPAASKGVGAAD